MTGLEAAPDRTLTDTSQIRYSFLIPANGRDGRVRPTLRALAAIEAPAGSFEAVVVFDGAVAESLKASLGDSARGMPLAVLEQQRSGPARARNLAASRARGEWFVFLDDDCRLSPDFLRVLEPALTPDPSLALGGHAQTARSVNVWTLATHIVVEAFIESQRRPCGSFDFLLSRNLVLHRAAWERTGGFDEDFRFAGGEDREFCYRWTHCGGRFVRLEQLRYVHDDPLGLGDFLRKHVQYGQGAARFQLKSGRPPGGRYDAFWREVARRLGATRPRSRIPALAVALALSQLATLAGMLFAETRTRFIAGR